MFNRLSVLGLYRFDDTIFDTLQLPAEIDREQVVSNILMNCAELSIVYSDPEYFKEMIGIWSARRSNIWLKLYNTTIQEYNIIHNYDRTEEWLDNGEDNVTGSGKNVGQVQAFNSNSFTDRTQDTSTTTAKNTRKNLRTGRAFGNIGITTTQQMLREEREIVNFSVIEEIVKDFKKDFCICIY